MLAGITRSAVVAAIVVPLAALAAPSASAEQPTAANVDQPVASNIDMPLRTNVDAPYISVNICVHIPTPGSATLDWCWP
ncbi:hypothetical protein [Nocardia aurantiaca]|uniref:Uncharacterized protein n=1 Tax=Nocardia aurantiaca TaxID=2675850 RepID=A0A6I3KNE1_9NOCA|nr:hypothetical protein [Nocardia aurantiaca]MTE11502.1 hypothetical protein [Nocardia aurantiaca]